MQDPVGSILDLLTFLIVLATGFFLVQGLWEALLRHLFAEAKELEEKSTLKALRKVILRRMAMWNRHIVWPKYERAIGKRIIYAGGLDGLQVDEFMGLQQLSGVGFLLFGYVLINFLKNDLNVEMSWIWLLVFGLFGLVFPVIWLRDQVAKRHLRITRELPYNLDLLTLSMEAGLDFQPAVNTVVQKGRTGDVTKEFGLMLKEMRMGKTRQEALRAMAERVGLTAVSQFVNALVQADRMGTSLGRVLRIQSTQLRVQRTQRAEKLAQEAPVKMLFPLIACIFPTVFMILFGPILFMFIFGGAMG